jgi:hypothetical protein
MMSRGNWPKSHNPFVPGKTKKGRKGKIMYQRKTYDEYEIQGNYGYGWEMVTTEETRQAAKEQLKCYRENEPNAAHRIVKIRVKKLADLN